MTQSAQTGPLYPISFERAFEIADAAGLSQYTTTILPGPFVGFVFEHIADVASFRLRFADVSYAVRVDDVVIVLVSRCKWGKATFWLDDHCHSACTSLDTSSVSFGSTQDRMRFEAAL